MVMKDTSHKQKIWCQKIAYCKMMVCRIKMKNIRINMKILILNLIFLFHNIFELKSGVRNLYMVR